MEKEVMSSLEQIIPDSQLNEWERDELIELLDTCDTEVKKVVFEQIAVIWPVSHALCFAFLAQLHNGLHCLETKQLPEWVKGILHVYEAEGLRAAQLYMEDVENNFLCQLRGESGLLFTEAQGRLVPYVRGVSGKSLQVASSDMAATDTATIFLPRECSYYRDNYKNFQVYKLLSTFQCIFIQLDLYCQNNALSVAIPSFLEKKEKVAESGEDLLMPFFRNFPHQQLAQDIYHLLQTIRCAVFMEKEFPGLMRDIRPFFSLLQQGRTIWSPTQGVGYQLEKIKLWLLDLLGSGNPIRPDIDPSLVDLVESLWLEPQDNAAIFKATREFYDVFRNNEMSYEPLPPLPFQGRFIPLEAHQARLARREHTRQKFIEALAAILPSQAIMDKKNVLEKEQASNAANVVENGANITPVQHSSADKKEDECQPGQETRFICLDDEHLELPNDLRSLVREIKEDLGSLPAFYISSASQQAGNRGRSPASAHFRDEGQELQGGLLFDEWDYRRQGFRSNWCRLNFKRLHGVKGTFVPNTMEKYRGQILQLKRQFEMMRTQHRFVGRQREGEDVDLDALTEAFADVKAGLIPSERLYIRLQRDERDIAALFLVDMSSSTEGWVGTALKEALVLLSEALDSLGDRYAIYGFSGMRRTRSEIYHIKGFEEDYSDEIKGRIAAIAPVDYTRMGPPIRYFTDVLVKMDAKVRLLIILTDGKPEDYDDYKGEYAIEDTRHALLEARNAGIHPFCITIDREAQDYMGHMFGEINYTFINDVKKLPLRVPEIYRMLTS